MHSYFIDWLLVSQRCLSVIKIKYLPTVPFALDKLINENNCILCRKNCIRVHQTELYATVPNERTIANKINEEV